MIITENIDDLTFSPSIISLGLFLINNLSIFYTLSKS